MPAKVQRFQRLDNADPLLVAKLNSKTFCAHLVTKFLESAENSGKICLKKFRRDIKKTLKMLS
jgi:hypothetical protein